MKGVKVGKVGDINGGVFGGRGLGDIDLTDFDSEIDFGIELWH